MLNSMVTINLYEWLKKDSLVEIIRENKVEINNLFKIFLIIRSHIYYQIFTNPQLASGISIPADLETI